MSDIKRKVAVNRRLHYLKSDSHAEFFAGAKLSQLSR
jgi:hypothetical protein